MNIYDLLKDRAVRVVFFGGSSLTTSAVQVTDNEDRQINYPCAGLRIKNLSVDDNLKYSFDNSHWQELAYFEETEVIKDFNNLYVKMVTSSTGQYQGFVVKLQ